MKTTRGNIFTDIAAAVKLTGEVRKARKEGADSVKIKPVYTVQCVTLKPAYLNTIEGCLTWELGREADRSVMEVFKSLPYETQRRLEFTPKEPGGWADRARFWQQQLKPALPTDMYHAVMIRLISWYAHCLRRRRDLHEKPQVV